VTLGHSLFTLELISVANFGNFFLLRSFKIIDLEKNSRKIFEFKGLICKIFRNKDLALPRALKMGLGQLRGPSW
jgi:hypothetical protein